MGPVNTPRLPLACPLPRAWCPPPPCRFCLRPRKRRLRKLRLLGRGPVEGVAVFSCWPASEGTAAGVSGAENDESPEFSGESDGKLLVSIVCFFSLNLIRSPDGNLRARRKIFNVAARTCLRFVMAAIGNVSYLQNRTINLI